MPISIKLYFAFYCSEQVIAHVIIYRRRAYNEGKPIFTGAHLCDGILAVDNVPKYNPSYSDCQRVQLVSDLP